MRMQTYFLLVCLSALSLYHDHPALTLKPLSPSLFLILVELPEPISLSQQNFNPPCCDECALSKIVTICFPFEEIFFSCNMGHGHQTNLILLPKADIPN